MRALQLRNAKSLILDHVAHPVLKEGEVLINVVITGMGGSEYLGFRNPGIRPLPNIMGHGICGLTQDGQRVAINPLQGCHTCAYCKQNMVQLCAHWTLIGVQKDGGFAEQVAVPLSSLNEIPDNINWEQSSFIEPFANAINAWDIARCRPDEKVLIIGAGGIGLGLAACSRRDLHDETYVVELSKNRLLAAEELGAKPAVQKDHSYDIVFDTVGSEDTRQQAIAMTKPNGKIIFIGFETAKQNVNFSELIRLQYQFMGSFVYSKKQFSEAVDLVKYTKSEWVKNVSFEEVEAQLSQFLSNDFSVVKAALRPRAY